MTDPLLLTPTERGKAVYERCEEMGVKWVNLLVKGNEERIVECEKAVAEAQLVKAEPLIRKAERKRVIDFIDWLDNGLRSSADWRFETRKFRQALKEEK